MVDVGLHDAQETVSAVKSGFVVYSFEPVAHFVNNAVRGLEKHSLDFFMVKFNDDGSLAEALPQPKPGKAEEVHAG